MSAKSKNRFAKPASTEVIAQNKQKKWHAAIAQNTF